MNKIKEKDLTKLGFKKEKNTPIHELDEREFYYFVYEINKHCLLISDDNFEAEANGGYCVEFYEIPELKFSELDDLQVLIKLLKKASK